MGSPVAMPIGAASLTNQPGAPRRSVIAVETTPPGAFAPLFAAVRRGDFAGESVSWLAGDLDVGRSLQAAYACLHVNTTVAEVRFFMLVFEEISMWRSFLFDDPRPDWLLLGNGSDERVVRLCRGDAPADLSEQDFIPVPNPPLPPGIAPRR